ncbi:hypothetical protein AnigIFM50267_004130, partial [Aspergillus niger]
MANISYRLFLETIFKSPNVDLKTQLRMIEELSDEENDLQECTGYSRRLLSKAHSKGFNNMTRFVPPYCSTVTFYKDTVGFVTVSRLGPDFDSIVTDIGCGCFVSNGAIKTIEQAYADIVDLNRVKRAAQNGGYIGYTRDKTAHKNALGRM